MAEFLTTSGTAHRLERLVEGASSQLTLISPFLQVSRILLERLRDAAERGVQIAVVCRAADLKDRELSQLQQIPNLQLRFMDNLHAKCYLSDTGVVVSSMNLYHYSEQTNREMGVYFSASEAPYGEALKEVKSILSAATPAKPQPYVGSVSRAPDKSRGSSGYCLRCHRGISRDPERPLCIDCYRVWAEFANPDYPERYCHDCGRETSTSMARPLCRACYTGAAVL
jgi:hypothetical protein